MKNRIVKVKNSIIEFEKDFTELKGRVKIKIRKEIEKHLFKQISGSIDDMDKFEKKRNDEKRLSSNSSW